ncbi:E3 ubiquitin-protein ligase TRAIP [Trichoplax sp. H2]|nr:E3 ubiquitin-protein ligase TRAIP [Trichoplax sp. H2]|eukprot:RDD39118.1 E3 ubiquitin-protein ligase TRAIP [Trichoplax sp. H2]
MATFPTCPICTDGTSYRDEDLAAGRCGHVFHYSCLEKWVIQSKTCPTCRNRCTKRDIIKLFFDCSRSDDCNTSNHLTDDPQQLRMQLDKYIAIYEKRDSQYQKILNENQDLEEELSNLKDTLKTTKLALRDYKKINKDLKEQQEETLRKLDQASFVASQSNMLHEKLRRLDGLRSILESNSDEVDKMIKHVGEGPAAIEQLCTYISSLKKEYEKLKESKKFIKSEKYNLEIELRKYIKLSENAKSDLEDMKKRFTAASQKLEQYKLENGVLQKKLKIINNKLRNFKKQDISSMQKKMLTLHDSPVEIDFLENSVDDEGSSISRTNELRSANETSSSLRAIANKNGLRFVDAVDMTSARTRVDIKKKEYKENKTNSADHFSHFEKNAKMLTQKNDGVVRFGFNGLGGHSKVLHLQKRSDSFPGDSSRSNLNNSSKRLKLSKITNYTLPLSSMTEDDIIL